MREGAEDFATDADVIDGNNIKAMDHIFPDAHACKVPPSIQKAHQYSKTSPNRRNLPNKFPIDIYINRFLTMWIMPCNHVTHFLFFATITFFITRRWLPYTVELIALYDTTNHQSFAHLGKLECYIEDCPKHIVDELWKGCYTWSTLLVINLWIAWRRVFRRFSGKPWMDPNFTSCNRLPMVTSWMRYMVDENCAREVACRPELTATANENYDARYKSKDYMDLAPNLWNLDGDQWEFQLRSTVERALDVVYNDYDDSDSHHLTFLQKIRSFFPKKLPKNEVREWIAMTVPSLWTMIEGIPDNPIYTNIRYPFPCVPPFIPVDENSSGVYKLTFDLPRKWTGDLRTLSDDYMITFHGVEAAFFLFVNHEYVGYSQDSRLSASFDITPHLRDCNNVMHVVVCRFCDGSYLEDQDHWWNGGIFRSVEMTRRPFDMDIVDFRVQGDAVDISRGIGRLNICVELKEHATSTYQNKKLCFKLFADEQLSAISDVNKKSNMSEGELIWSDVQELADPDEKSSRSINVSSLVECIKFWSDEAPSLYTLVIGLVSSCDDKETLCQVESCRIGFRTVDIYDGRLLVNNKQITICGINRHEHDPLTGKTVTVESMMKDIILAKRFNFNAIRTSHYPNAVAFYRLCDFYGIFVCDEANIETHGMMPMGKLADDFAWAHAFDERVTRMVSRDRNHTSIILWSLGNECGRGRNLNLARESLQLIDKSRPICYEGGGDIFEGSGQTELTDVVCPMYSNVKKTIDLAQQYADRPVILCEYSHAMGNSNGNLREYWDAFRDDSLPNLQGGFIWDMIDQGIKLPNTCVTHYGYGGDFEIEPYSKVHDAQFCINGLFSPDRNPHPAAFEAKYLQQPIQIKLPKRTASDERKTMSIVGSLNEDVEFFFEKTFHTFSWENVYVEFYYTTDDCQKDGNIDISANSNVSSKSIDKFVHYPKANEKSFSSIVVHTLDRASRYLADSNRCWITFRWFFRKPKSWQRIGDKIVSEPIAFDRIELVKNVPIFRSRLPGNFHLRELAHDIKVQDTMDSVEIWIRRKNEKYLRVAAVLSKKTGCLESFKNTDGMELLTEPLLSNFTRAATDNDRGGIDRIIGLMPTWVAWHIRLVENVFFKYSYHYRWSKYLCPDKPPNPKCTNVKSLKLSQNAAIIQCDIDMVAEEKIIFTMKIIYNFRSDGCVNLTVNVDPLQGAFHRTIPSFPRIGFHFTADETLSNMLYLGLGDNENYQDRKAGSELGLWSSCEGYDYIVPSENGCRSDCSWLCLRNKASKGFLIAACNDDKGRHTFDFSALLHNQQELHQATHTHKLEPRQIGRNNLFINIDLHSMGIGGDVSWSPCVYDKYLLKPDKIYEGSFWLCPLSNTDIPSQMGRYKNYSCPQESDGDDVSI